MEIKRKCASCKTLKNREEMIKITKLQNGSLKINPNSKELGRSVYVCKNQDCIKKFIKKKTLKTALKYSNLAEIEKIEAELQNLI
jgi:predicted RNA-binding protein YlxR (DUF448 family)